MPDNDCARLEPEVSALLDGELAGPQAAVVEAHLRSCPACAVLARDLAAVSRTLRALDPKEENGAVSAGFRARVLAGVDAGPRAASPARRPAALRDAKPPVASRSPRPALRLLVPAAAAAAGAVALLGAGVLAWDAVRVAGPGPAGHPGGTAGAAVASAPDSAAGYLERAARHEAEGRADLARRAVLAAYGLDPGDARVREAVARTLGFDPDGLDRERVAATAPDPRAPADPPAGGALAGRGEAEGQDLDLRIGSWRFDSPVAYDRFLQFRERSWELEMAHAAREVRAAETTTVAPERAAPEAPNPLAATLAAVRVGRPVGGGGGTSAAYDGLTIYPLRPEEGTRLAGAVPWSLRDALDHGRVSVRDPLRPNDATVWVTHHATDRPLLLLAGEVLEGGRSDRMVARDVLVPAGAKNLPVPVYDVEVGRSSTTWGSRFRDTPGVAGAMLRGLALAQVPPEAVAGFVSDRLDMLFVKKSRRSLVDAFDDRGPVQPVLRMLRPQVEVLVEGLRPEGITGFAVAHGRHLLALEVFGSHDLMMLHAPRLLEGYALEASTFAGGGLPPSAGTVEAMVRAAARGAFFRGSAGEGSEFGVLSSEGALLGCGVAFRGGLYHASVLNGAGAAAIRGDRDGRGGEFPGASPAPGETGAEPGGRPPSAGGSGSGSGSSGAEGATTGGSEGSPPPPAPPVERDR